MRRDFCKDLVAVLVLGNVGDKETSVGFMEGHLEVLVRIHLIVVVLWWLWLLYCGDCTVMVVVVVLW